MKFNTLLLFLFLAFQSFSQDQARFHSLCNQACKAIEEGMIDHAYILLKDAFSLNIPPRAADYLNMAKCYSQQNDADSTEKYIYLAFEKNPKIGNAIRVHNLWFNPILGERKWNEIVELTKNIPIKISDNIVKLGEHFDDLQSKYIAIQRKYSENRTFFLNDSILVLEYTNDLDALTDSIAPFLDSIFKNTPAELLIHPAVEEGFLMLIHRMKGEYFEERRDFFESLIAKGFLTPDLLIGVYINEYFGIKRNQFMALKYNPNYFEYYSKYGTTMDDKMYSYRLHNYWKYDE